MVAALRDAGRVVRPDGRVLIQVWGRHAHCTLDAIKPIIRPLVSGDPDAPPPPDLSEPGLLEGIASAAGLEPETAFDLSWAYEYQDDDALVRSLLSAASIGDAAGEREDEVRQALIDVLAPYRTPEGGYVLENQWHFLLTRA
jgi:hypothetical protein